MTDLEALVAYCRAVPVTAHEWLYELSTLERELIASTAAVRAGTTPVAPDTVVVRQVYVELQKPSVLLGENVCVYCGRELKADDCPEGSCEANFRRPTSLNRFGGRNR